MSSGQSYPSPTTLPAQPFYTPTQQAIGGAGEPMMARPEEQDNSDVPDDAELRANLSRTLGAQLMGGFGSLSGRHPLPYAPQVQQQNESLEQYDDGARHLQLQGSPDSQDDQGGKKDKRTKASRACDECRRKKIRCDAPDETGQTACTSCTRTGAKCAFSRQPMKRGPSKGYIKELADRLNQLEQQVHPSPQAQLEQQDEVQQMQQATTTEQQGHTYVADNRLISDLLGPRTGDKRPHSIALDGPPPSQDSRPWGARQVPQAQMQQPPALQSMPERRPPGDHQSGTQPFWRPGDSTPQESQSLPYEIESSAAVTFDWDESVIEEYYRLIHQTFPLLPNSKLRLRQRLADCPQSLREACLTALDCLMRTFPTTTLLPNPSYSVGLKRAAELLAGYPFDHPGTHTNGTNLVYLQTLLLMALESDNHGPATIRGQAGPSRAEWLGRAAGVAGQLEINLIRPRERFVIEGDPDSEERLARRVWWVLFILDRWHASSTADLLKLPENSVVLLPEDQILLGESTYHLARLSFIIGHLAAILTTTKTPTTNVMAPSNPASSLLSLTLAGEIDRFRESVESVWGSLNLVHLSYHHCHLLIRRLNPTSEPSEMVGHAVKVATVLNSRMTPVTPLNHHFGALAGMTLCELCDVPQTCAEAIKGLEQMVECLSDGRGLAGRQESEGWDGAIRELVVRKKERLQQVSSADGGLQSLAEAAVNEGSSGSGKEGNGLFDPTMLTRYGYLTALGQGMFKSK